MNKKWIERTLSAMSLEDKLAQLLILPVGNEDMENDVAGLLSKHRIGGVFTAACTPDEARQRMRRLQEASALPLVVAADLEQGIWNERKQTTFPHPMALSAADSVDLAYEYGKITALQGRSLGVHWTFAPVVDVNLNPDNPITCTRSFGDSVEQCCKIGSAVIKGLQEHGMAACPKHFPGDGTDDVDQHISTPVNRYSLDEWKRISGKVFKTVYDAGAMTTMIGHIALPAVDPQQNDAGLHRPASISKPIISGLLRAELGFDGLIVTDDMSMGGVCGYMKRAERVVAAINAGCDMYLFPNMAKDYPLLLDAARTGALSIARINEACKRVLTLKAALGLEDPGNLMLPDGGFDRKAGAVCTHIAERTVTLVRDVRACLPVQLGAGDEVLTVTMGPHKIELDTVDAELQRRGLNVTHLQNPSHDHAFEEFTAGFKAVFVNFVYRQTWGYGTVRPVGYENRNFFNGFFNEHPCAIFTSFGSPYILKYIRGLPNFTNIYATAAASQVAAVKFWFGEIGSTGKSPVII
ncbi:MAG: hypothetical protein GF398_03945 [Chitinivibrionales bacterium]|nr:hypothetical protein [Chitinivibrionales bacterium]